MKRRLDGVILGPCPCQGCRRLVEFQTDLRWHDVRGPAHSCIDDGDRKPSLNELRRAHWHERADQMATWRQAAKLSALAALRDAGSADDYPLRSALVRIVAITPTRARRDPDNFAGACKPLLDGIVDARVLADDSFGVIRELSVITERGPLGVRIEVLP